MVVLRQLFGHRLKSNRTLFSSDIWQSHRWNVRQVNWIEGTYTLVPWQGHTTHVQGFGSEGGGSLKRQLHTTSRRIVIPFALVLTYIFLHLCKETKNHARPRTGPACGGLRVQVVGRPKESPSVLLSTVHPTDSIVFNVSLIAQRYASLSWQDQKHGRLASRWRHQASQQWNPICEVRPFNNMRCTVFVFYVSQGLSNNPALYWKNIQKDVARGRVALFLRRAFLRNNATLLHYFKKNPNIYIYIL